MLYLWHKLFSYYTPTLVQLPSLISYVLKDNRLDKIKSALKLYQKVEGNDRGERGTILRLVESGNHIKVDCRNHDNFAVLCYMCINQYFFVMIFPIFLMISVWLPYSADVLSFIFWILFVWVFTVVRAFTNSFRIVFAGQVCKLISCKLKAT